MNNTLLKLIIIITSGITLATAFIYKSEMDYHNNLVAEQNTSLNELKKQKQRYKTKQLKVQYQVKNAIKQSKNPNIKYIDNNNSDISRIARISKKFFYIYYTWDNQKQYARRPELVSDICSPRIISNKNLFDNGKDSLGGSYIDSLSLHCRFKEQKVSILDFSPLENHINALILVTFQSWRSSKVQESNSSKGQRIFKVTYDKKQNTITQISPIMRVNMD